MRGMANITTASTAAVIDTGLAHGCCPQCAPATVQETVGIVELGTSEDSNGCLPRLFRLAA